MGDFLRLVMCVVTLLTAIYLIKTFRSQKSVQQLQQTITDVEVKKYLEQIRPDFGCEVNFDFTRHNTAMLLVKNRIPKSLKYSFSQQISTFKEVGIKENGLLSHSTQINDLLQIYFTFDPDEPIFHGMICSLDIEYSDDLGTKYEIKFLIKNDLTLTTKAGPHIIEFPNIFHNPT